MKRLKSADKRILNRLQEGIPFVERPWKAVAEELSVKEDFLLKRVALLKKQGIVRRISANFSSRKIGFVSTLVAAKVASENIEEAAEKINSYPEVTHNYKRDSEYNIWFTLVAKDNKRISEIKEELRGRKEFKRILDFPALKLFKVDVNFLV